jgi:SHS2 domain-containing protein
MKYKFIDDLTSDVMFEAYGKDLKELFGNAAEALFTVMTQRERLKESLERDLVVEAEDVKELMVDWLQELIARVDIDGVFFKRFEVTEATETRIKARCFGQEAKPELGETVVKAVTYYKLAVGRTDKGWKARVALDI